MALGVGRQGCPFLGAGGVASWSDFCHPRSGMQRWASSRRQFLIQAGRLAGAAAGLGSAAGALTRRAEAAVRAVTENSTVTYDFAAAADRASWGAKWLALHYLRPADVLDGWARFSVPDGLSTTAPAQPMPIF